MTAPSSPKSETPAPKRLAGMGAALLVVVAGAIALGVVPRLREREALSQALRDHAGPRNVRAVSVVGAPPNAEITLPGTTRPFRSTTLYAKSTGFVRRNRVEVGDHVKFGAVLAEIDAPETDQDIRVARARLEESQTNVTIVQQMAERNRALAKQGVVSQQMVDDSLVQANTASATVKAREADLQRLRTLRGYQDVVAPFDGVVTKRSVDPGALVGPAGAGSMPLFELAQVEPLRIFVDVPQSLAPGVTVGLAARVALPSASSPIAGKVVRTSTVLDQALRTLRTEVELPQNDAILPGAFVYVTLIVPRPDPPMLVSASALAVRKEGTMLARVEGDKVKLVPVTIARDLGKELEIRGALKAGDRVVTNPQDDLSDGTSVAVVEERRDGG